MNETRDKNSFLHEANKELRQVLAAFDNANIGYALLRNYEFLLIDGMPESLDTLLAEKDFLEAENILLRQGFTQRKPQFSLKHRAFFKLVDLHLVSFDIQVGGVYWNDMPYLHESVLAHRKKNVCFYTLSEDDTFVMLVAHSILGKRFFRQKYQHILSFLAPKVDKEKVVKQLSFIFNQRIAQKVWTFVQQRQFSSIPFSGLVAYFIAKKLKHLTTFVPLCFRWMIWKKPLKLAPLISFVGPDGAGKSLQVENLCRYLKEQKRMVAVVYNGRGRKQFLPVFELARRYKWAERIRDRKRANENVNENYKRKILYTVASPLYAFDLYLRYLFRILPYRIKRNIVITDRYCTDIILMQNVPFWLRKWFYGLYPAPSISIFLYNTPEVLHQRRPKESLAELERQLSLFMKFDHSLKLQTTDPEKDTEKVISFVYSWMLKNWY